MTGAEGGVATGDTDVGHLNVAQMAANGGAVGIQRGSWRGIEHVVDCFIGVAKIFTGM